MAFLQALSWTLIKNERKFQHFEILIESFEKYEIKDKSKIYF